jgi:hypothetical protein
MIGFCWAKRKKQKLKERQEQLYAIICKEGISERASAESSKAIAFCQARAAEYNYWWELNESNWYFWQGTAIIAGVLATIAGAISIPDELQAAVPWLSPSMPFIRSLLAALATAAAGYLGSFTYREDAVRHKLTEEKLWNELAKYQTRAAPYNKAEAKDTSLFVNNVCRLVGSELEDWSTLVGSNRPDSCEGSEAVASTSDE